MEKTRQSSEKFREQVLNDWNSLSTTGSSDGIYNRRASSTSFNQVPDASFGVTRNQSDRISSRDKYLTLYILRTGLWCGIDSLYTWPYG